MTDLLESDCCCGGGGGGGGGDDDHDDAAAAEKTIRFATLSPNPDASSGHKIEKPPFLNLPQINFVRVFKYEPELHCALSSRYRRLEIPYGQCRAESSSASAGLPNK
jgi:hypothetical protein